MILCRTTIITTDMGIGYERYSDYIRNVDCDTNRFCLKHAISYLAAYHMTAASKIIGLGERIAGKIIDGPYRSKLAGSNHDDSKDYQHLSHTLPLYA